MPFLAGARPCVYVSEREYGWCCVTDSLCDGLGRRRSWPGPARRPPQAPASAAQLAESTGSAAGLPPAAPAAAAKAGRRAKKPPVASAPPRKAEALPAKSPEKALLTSEEDRRKAPDSPRPAESLLAKSSEKVVLEPVEVKRAAEKKSPGRAAHAPRHAQAGHPCEAPPQR